MKLYDEFLRRFEQVAAEHGTEVKEPSFRPAGIQNLVGLAGDLAGTLYVRPNPAASDWSISPSIVAGFEELIRPWVLILPTSRSDTPLLSAG